MSGLFQSKNQTVSAGRMPSQTEFEKAPGNNNQQDSFGSPAEYQEIRTMPKKFLIENAKVHGNRTPIAMSVIILLIIIISGFTALLFFSDYFNQLIFGQRKLPIKSEPASAPVAGNSSSEETSAGSKDPVAVVKPAIIFEVKAENEQKEVIGSLKVEVPQVLASYEIRAWEVEFVPNVIYDESGQAYNIIGGVYSWYPPSINLGEDKLLTTITYRVQDLPQEISPSGLKIAIWSEESKAAIFVPEVDAENGLVAISLGSVPAGDMAIVTEASQEAPIITAPDEVASALDTDNDGLTDEEETLYRTNLVQEDSDGDGYFDGGEILSLYNPSGQGNLLDSGLVQSYSNTVYGYSLFYPQSWLVTASQGEQAARRVIFQAPSLEEQIEVSVEDNPGALSSLDWYLAQAPGVSPNELLSATVSGREAVWSPDRFNLYLAQGNFLYLIRYNVGIKDSASFRTTFQMMIESFNLRQESKISYQNEAYRFSLDLPASWQAYQVATSAASVSTSTYAILTFKLPTKATSFCPPDGYCELFKLLIVDYNFWSELQKSSAQPPELIDASGKDVFAYTKYEITASDLSVNLAEVPEIISSFKLISQ